MTHILKLLEWKIDLYVLYFMYSPHKKYRYHRYMLQKWGEKYKSKFSTYDNQSKINLN